MSMHEHKTQWRGPSDALAHGLGFAALLCKLKSYGVVYDKTPRFGTIRPPRETRVIQSSEAGT
jgi:hypothetical protein